MWRLQDLYDFLVKDPHYSIQIILLPFLTYAEEEKERSLKELKRYFDKMHCPYMLYNSPDCLSQWKENRPDIIFYQQLYSTIYSEPYSINSNLDRLICHIPYGLSTVNGEWLENILPKNLAWKLFYPTQSHADFARSHSFNRGKNVVVVGEPNAKRYLASNYSYPWKPQSAKRVKKVIWAPHFSISDMGYLHRASFLWMADYMKDIVNKYEGRIQFVFKPHPRLISALYSHREWGKSRTDQYFNWWENTTNTQVETGEFIDLFMTSDAMIHDCGSFTAEYLYSNNPVLFTAKNFPQVYSGLNPFGVKCLDLHYKAQTEKEILSFLEDVVLEGNDPLADGRHLFYKNVLMKETASDVGHNIYHVLNMDLFGIEE